MKDYSHLKGKEIKVRNTKMRCTECSKKRTVNCFIADIDKKVGITIKSTNTQDDVFCLNKMENNDKYFSYTTKFNKALKLIEEGYLDTDKWDFDMNGIEVDEFYTSVGCAF